MKTVLEICEMFKVTKASVYNWINDGLPCQREKIVGKKTRIIINPNDVIEYHKTKGQGEK